MRTSRTSKETAKVLEALAPRSTRSRNVSALKTFAYQPDPTASVPSLSGPSDDESSLSEANTADIEDLIEPPPKRQKRTSPVSVKPDPELESESKPKTPAKAKAKAKPRLPARKTRDENGVKVEPPSNWEIMYDTVMRMRKDNPTAPVDTMGCAELYWRASGAQDRRFQTLIALMLSSQTKDTVTAVAMQRLHTELGSDSQPLIKVEDSDRKEKDSTLTIGNIIAVDPGKLNELIWTVGFHNNKTKYIKATALILRDQYAGDIPSTPEGLMALPGVGPKMAYLCLSAAWGKHLGIGVDVHVHRITNLWGWNKTKTPEETRLALQSWLPHEKWHEINWLLVGLGQTVCLPVKRRCGDCYLAGSGLCKSEVKGMAPSMGIKKVDEPKVKIEAI